MNREPNLHANVKPTTIVKSSIPPKLECTAVVKSLIPSNLKKRTFIVRETTRKYEKVRFEKTQKVRKLTRKYEKVRKKSPYFFVLFRTFPYPETFVEG